MPTLARFAHARTHTHTKFQYADDSTTVFVVVFSSGLPWPLSNVEGPRPQQELCWNFLITNTCETTPWARLYRSSKVHYPRCGTCEWDVQLLNNIIPRVGFMNIHNNYNVCFWWWSLAHTTNDVIYVWIMNSLLFGLGFFFVSNQSSDTKPAKNLL